MNTQISAILTKIKQSLETDPSNITFGEISSGANNVDGDIIPYEYADFLHVSNGIRCGVAVLFGTESIPKEQYKAELIDGGKEQWFCIGLVLYQTLAINLQTHNVYLFYDLYFYDDRTENAYRNLGEFDDFLTDFVFGERYSELIPELKLKDDKWYNFIQKINKEHRPINIKDLVHLIKSAPDCTVQSSNGIPLENSDITLPEDLTEFYKACGGIIFYSSKDTFEIVPPEEVVPANPVIVGELCEEDISSQWYIIAKDSSNYITIDLSPERLGRCYDSFWDCHGVVGECAVVANSFTELVQCLYDYKGNGAFWLDDDFEYLGDAYDEV